MDKCVANVVNSNGIKEKLESSWSLRRSYNNRELIGLAIIIPENYVEAAAKVGKCKDEIKLVTFCIANSNEGIQTKSTSNFSTN